MPLGTRGRVVGAARIEPAPASDTIGREHAQAIAALVAQGVWRLRLLDASLAARAEVERQHVQATFLASVSHDLRTPLAAIVAAASSLRGAARAGSAKRSRTGCSRASSPRRAI